MRLEPCHVCGKEVVLTDNGIYLNYPAEEWSDLASWTLMVFGSMTLATNGDPDMFGQGHRLHDHQPVVSALT